MRPILLKSHERPVTEVRFNRDGDLLFSVAKDKTPVVWFTHNGERLGTFGDGETTGHNGAVWGCDISHHSTRLLTASSDQTAKLWCVRRGLELFSFEHKSPVRAVKFALGERMMLTASDTAMGQQSSLFVYNLTVPDRETERLGKSRAGKGATGNDASKPTDEDKSESAAETKADFRDQARDPVRTMCTPGMGAITGAVWRSLNQTIITTGADGKIRVWDVETGKEIAVVEASAKQLTSIRYSHDQTMFIVASKDQAARLYDTKTCERLKIYRSNTPLNDACISPTHHHVICGGGQDERDVTVTSTKSGRFESTFFHTVYEHKLGQVRGHFGPINTLSFNVDGKSFASGSVDGYVRLHHFDADYFKSKLY